MHLASQLHGMLQSSGELWRERKLSQLQTRAPLARTRPTELNVLMTHSIDQCDSPPASDTSSGSRAVSSSSSITLKTRVNNIIHGFAAKALEKARTMAPELTNRAVHDINRLHSTATSLIHDLNELLEAQEVRKQGRILKQQYIDPSSTDVSGRSEFKGSSTSTTTSPLAPPLPLPTLDSSAINRYSSVSQPLLLPFIDRADETEVQYAALLADLCNLAYEATTVDAHSLATKHRLALVTHCSAPVLGALTRDQHWARVRVAHASGLTTDQAFALEGKAGPGPLPSSSPSDPLLATALSSVGVGQQSSLGNSSHSSADQTHSPLLSPSPIDAKLMSFASRVMDTIEECQLDDMTDTCGGAMSSLRPPSPDVEYSLLLGSIEDIFESMEEEEAHALTRIMSLSRPPTPEVK